MIALSAENVVSSDVLGDSDVYCMCIITTCRTATLARLARHEVDSVSGDGDGELKLKKSTYACSSRNPAWDVVLFDMYGSLLHDIILPLLVLPTACPGNCVNMQSQVDVISDIILLVLRR